MKNKNLIIGREIQVRNALNESTNCISKELTNGSYASVSDSSSWFEVYSGVTEFSVDLGSPFSVCGFSVAFLHDVENSVFSPENVKLLLSDNGEEFYEVLKVNAPYPASFKYEAKATYSAELSEACLARFVKIRFCGETTTKCAELRLFGGEPDGNELRLSGAVFKDVFKDKFASAESVCGVSNIPLVYFGSLDESGEVTRLTREDFKPLLAYVDCFGVERSAMFETIALCQSSQKNEGIENLSDWETLIDELFVDKANLKALDEEYRLLKTKLSLGREKTLGIYLTVPVPKFSFETFGDLNGDGIEEKLLTTEDCIAAFKWFVDAVTRRFNAECLPNLKIEGFVWNNNKITRELRDDETFFVTECVKGLHKRGYKCIFVGTQFASGVEKTQKIGFDCVTLTPIKENGSISKTAVSVCKKYELGVNITAPNSPYNREEVGSFVKQMSDCIMLDMVDTVHTIDKANVFVECAKSNEETIRLIYDGLYEFITRQPEEVEAVAENVQPEPELTFNVQPQGLDNINEEPIEIEIPVPIVKDATEVNLEEELDEVLDIVVDEPIETIIDNSLDNAIENALAGTEEEEIKEIVLEITKEVQEAPIEISVNLDETETELQEEISEDSIVEPESEIVEETVTDAEGEIETGIEIGIETETETEAEAEAIQPEPEEILPPVNEKSYERYEVPSLKIEISVPSTESECSDKKCGYCSKFQEEQKPVERTIKNPLQLMSKSDRKAALAAAGVAVAIGTAYLIAKSLKGNNNNG